MKITKSIIVYFISSLVSFLLAFIYMRIILGAKPESASAFMKMLSWLYDYVFLNVGLAIGSIVSVLFILTDIFYLKRKLSIGIKATIIRFFVIVFITFVVGTTHYILEKIIGVI